MLKCIRCLCSLQPAHVRAMSQYPPTYREPLLPASGRRAMSQYPPTYREPLLPASGRRAMSQYPPTYREPLLPASQTAESRDELAFSPMKAAPSDLTSSAFDHPAVKKFTNIIMKGGDKNLAQILMAKTFERIKRTQIQRLNEARAAGTIEDPSDEPVCDPLQVFLKALENSKPKLKLVPVIRGGITYQVPRPVTEKRATFMAMRWFKEAGREKDRKIKFNDRLAAELIAASNNEGRVVRLKQELHKQCEANRAYAHYTYG